MTVPEKIKADLDEATKKAICNRGSYCGDVRNFERNRKLPMQLVLRLLLGMTGGSLAKELHAAGVEATPAAFVQQRHKVSSSAFRDILREFNNRSCDPTTYKGYRVFAVDGTCVNMARNPEAKSFVCNDSAPKGYNQMHVNPLYDLCSNTYFDCVIQPQPKADEIGALTSMLYWNRFHEKTLFIADRGYESYNVIAHFLCREKVDFLLRVKQDRSAMREIAKLPMTELDTDIEFSITTTQTNEDKKNGYIFLQTGSKKGKTNSPKTRITRWEFSHINPFPMKFRVARFMLDTGEYETLITSLPRETFSLTDLKELYHMRWGIETSFRQLKYSVGLIHLHGKCDEFVEQEIYAALIMYNFCNRISREVVLQQKEENIYEYRVNLKMAIHLCKEFYRDPNADGEKLMREIAKHTIPIRPGRRDERNIKAKSFVGFTYRVAA